MRIRKYMAKSMREALLQIKQELGEEAIILKTRRIPKKIFSLSPQDEVEVTAAVDEQVKSTNPVFPPIAVNQTGVYSRPKASPYAAGDTIRQPVIKSTMPSLNTSVKNDNETPENTHYFELKEDIRELRDLVKTVLKSADTTTGGPFAGGWAYLYNRLIKAEVKTDIAMSIIEKVRGQKDIPDSRISTEFMSVFADTFPSAGAFKFKDDGPLVVAVVGPTGSGKTTTLAKLAAHYSLVKSKSVSIITADTYRIAAIEQIRTFAEIINIGLQVVFSPDELAAALEACHNDDIVLVDTAGRSQRNKEHMENLKQLLTALKPDEVHLALSATTKDSDLSDNLVRYQDCGVNRLIFTKLDETQLLGNVFNTVYTSQIPVSYFTFGQSVPDDIELAQPGRFAQRLWEGSAQ